MTRYIVNKPLSSRTDSPSYMGTKVAFREYVAAAIVAHSCLLLEMMPTLECWVTPNVE